MPTFRMEPVDARSPHWQRSWHRDACLISASTEAEARQRASAIFDQVAKPEAGSEALVNPWTDADLVRSAETSDVPHGMSDGMVALPDGRGGWQLRGGGGDGSET